ncbi:MAG: hypothetical protein K2X11_22505 [Acetobacteraceae bacterium]|nr:hypothetical protein [Acetobacteraceae bacterium]
MSRPLLVAILLLPLLGCATRPDREGMRDTAPGCVIPEAAAPAPVVEVPPLPWLSERSNAVAASIGALPALHGLGTPVRGNEALRRLALRQEVTERVLLALLDVSSTLAMIDCEGERGDQLRTRLQAAESRRARQLGIASIGLGAATAVVTGGLSFVGNNAVAIAGITGGLAEASAGAALLLGGADGQLRHPRNLLREAWERPARSTLFPAVVWRHLSRRDAGQELSELDALVLSWRQDGLLGAEGTPAAARREALLFGDGGRYDVSALEARDAMLDLLEARVALMSRDLRNLLLELRALPR